jgi:Mrp family chromosome partitioning ATPase/DUF971 family protein
MTIETMNKQDEIKELLKTIINPKEKKSIIDCGYLENISEDGDAIIITLKLPVTLQENESQFTSIIKMTIESELKCSVTVNINYDEPKNQLENVSSIIAVSSCKGGVGKSSVSVNLAFSLAEQGYKVGVFDADVYGPSLPTMVSHSFPELEVDGILIEPVIYDGVKLMSFGYTMIDGESGAAVLRGPMVSQIIQQLLFNTKWGELDYLILDLPPGTGDVQLTIGQLVNIDASLIVTTPQYISFIDVVKGIEMFDKLKIPTLSVVENMSYYKCGSCDDKHFVFGEGNLKKLKEEFGFKYAYGIPIEPIFAKSCDSGTPFILTYKDHEISSLFKKIAKDLDLSIKRLKREGYTIPRVDYDSEKGILIIPHNDSPYYIPTHILRINCNCAKCTDEFSGAKLLDSSTVKEDIAPLSMNPIGNYALGINWDDGHSSLYPYDKIKELIHATR